MINSNGDYYHNSDNGDNNIEIIAIVGGFNEDPKQEPVTPCGRCRQVIYEASQIVGKDIKVYCSNLNLSKIRVTTIEELLPFAFHLKEV